MKTLLLKIKNFFKIDKSLFKIDDGTSVLSLFALAIPLFIETISVHFIQMIQTMMSSNFMDGFFVSATSIVGSVTSPFIQIASMVSVGTGIILSINLGRKKYEDCKTIVGTAIFADLVICAVFYSLCILFAEELLAFMGYSGAEYAEKLPYAIELLKMRGWANMISHIPILFLAVLRCYGYTKVGLYTNIVSTVLTAILTYIMLYVIVPAKEYVMTGFIIIHVISAVVNIVLTLIYFIIKKIPVSFKFNFKWCFKIIKLGVPATIATLVYTITSTLTTRIAVSIGPNPYETRIFVQQLVYYIYIFGFQLAKASQIMIGRLCGMGDLDRANKMHIQNLKIVAALDGLLSLAFAAFGPLILKYGYAANAEIVAISVPVFFLDVIVEIGRGMNHIGQNGLNATGDVNFTTIISITVGFATSVGLAYVFAIWCKLGLVGMWIAYACDELIRGTIYAIRWAKGRWKKSFMHELEELEKVEQTA